VGGLGGGGREKSELEVGSWKKEEQKQKQNKTKQTNPPPLSWDPTKKNNSNKGLGSFEKKKKEQVPTFGPTSLQDPFTTPLDEFIQQETHVRQHEAANVETKEFRRVAGRQLETDVRG